MPRRIGDKLTDNNEYLCMSAYFASPPSLGELGRGMHAMTRLIIETLDPPRSSAPSLGYRAKVFIGTERGERDRRHVLPTPEAKGISSRSLDELDVLLKLPQETAQVVVYSEIRPTGARDVRLLFAVNYRPVCIPETHEPEYLDARLSVGICTAMFNDPEWIPEPGHEADGLIGSFRIDPRARSIIEHVVEIMARELGVYTGNVEITDEHETAAGRYYLSLGEVGQRLPWHRQVEHELWARAGTSRHEFVRRATWGTLIGPSIMRKLNQSGDWLAAFKAKCWPNADLGEHAEWTRKYNNGAVFLASGESPLFVGRDLAPNVGLVSRDWALVAALHRALCREGVLLY